MKHVDEYLDHKYDLMDRMISSTMFKPEETAEVMQALDTVQKIKKNVAKWKKYPAVYQCTNCKTWVDRYDRSGKKLEHLHIEHYRYCPSCGCKMEVDEND